MLSDQQSYKNLHANLSKMQKVKATSLSSLFNEGKYHPPVLKLHRCNILPLFQ
jgi:hypothetical protein